MSSLRLFKAFAPLTANVILKPNVQVKRGLALGAARLKKFSVSDETEVGYFDIRTNDLKQCTFAELKTLARQQKSSNGRDLVLVTTMRESNVIPTFRLASPNELEHLVRASRLSRGKKQKYTLVNLDQENEIDGGVQLAQSPKEKHLTVRADAPRQNVKMMEADMKKIEKWLAKDYFVKVKIVSHESSDKEVKQIQEMIAEKCLPLDDPKREQKLKTHLVMKVE